MKKTAVLSILMSTILLFCACKNTADVPFSDEVIVPSHPIEADNNFAISMILAKTKYAEPKSEITEEFLRWGCSEIAPNFV
ncbi:MAG: hypothetical protein ACK5L3_06555, partial [Oscillospiraceae bacterium]